MITIFREGRARRIVWSRLSRLQLPAELKLSVPDAAHGNLEGEGVPARERIVDWLAAVGFMLVAVPLAVFSDSLRAPSTLVVVAMVALYAAASLIQFDVGPGSAVPTQLVFVPMLFILPTGWVPLAAAAGFVTGECAQAARRRVRAKPIVLVGSSWYAIGPALVLMLAGEAAPSWSRWPLYAAAFAAQFAADAASTVVTGVIAWGTRPLALFRLVATVYAMDALLTLPGLAVAMLAHESPQTALAVAPLLVVVLVAARDRRSRIETAVDLGHAYEGTASLLGAVIGVDDEYTGTHSQGVFELSLAVSDALGLSSVARREVEFTSLLHDVGKLRIPKEIINKPGRLTDDERSLVETHTIEGEALLAPIGGFIAHIGQLVRSCHERYDGAGYPDRLCGDEIPLAARIVFCCDTYDAITSDRPYRAARQPHEALEELSKCSGTQFDPRIVAALTVAVAKTNAARREAAPAQAFAGEPPEASPEHAATTTPPAAAQTLTADRLVAAAVRDREKLQRVRSRARMGAASSTYGIGGAFAACAIGLPLLATMPHIGWPTLGLFALLTAAYAVAFGVEFEIGPGACVPTQLVFVPMLLVLPAPLIPLSVAIGILVRAGWSPTACSCPARERPFALLTGGWYAVAPAVLLIATATAPGQLSVPTLAVALALQLGTDAAINTIRVHRGLGLPGRDLFAALAWTSMVDIALTVIAFVIATTGRLPALAAISALMAFLSLLAADRKHQLARATHLTDAYRDAAERARRDPLTGLSNRRAWDEAIAAFTPNQPAVVIIVDIDNLKLANDTRGHDFGDTVIVECSTMLRNAALDATVCARLGGDEFGILLIEDTTHQVDQIVDHLKALFNANSLDGFPISAALGHAATPPCPTIHDAITLADQFAYVSKNVNRRLPSTPGASALLAMSDSSELVGNTTS